MDKITEILKEMHEMQDEPVRMQEGGVAGTLTPEEYQQQFIDYYAFPGIGVEAAPPADTEEEADEPVRPDILRPVGERGEGAPNIFRQVPIGTGPAYDVSDVDPNEYIANFGKETKKDYSGDGFNKYLKQAAEAMRQGGGIPGAVATVATGFPISGIAYGAAQLNRERQKENAEAIQAAGGNAGSMFTLNGQTVSRAPGSTRFDGTIVGMSNEQLYRLDEIRRGFVPGTMKETFDADPLRKGYTRTGKEALSSSGDVMIDAFGTVHGAGGPQMVGALQAERAREQMFRDAMQGRSLAGINVSSAALAMKQALDAEMSGSKSFFTTTARMSDADYNKALTRSQQFIQNYVSKNYGSEEAAAPTVTVTQQTPSETPQSEAAAKSDDNGGPTGGTQYSVTRDEPSYSSSAVDAQVTGVERQSFDATRDEIGLAVGGRIGMQAGGAAQQPQPAGFVGGPPENFTDGQTVADDQPMTVPEGTFVINAAAVEFAGSDDIKKMLSDAYGKMQKKVDKTIGVAKIPTEDEIDVAVSRGEVIVPPEVAKIIGYDRLEKINNRGKKEVARRQKKAGGGFLDGKKFADGGEIYEDRIIMEEVRRKMDSLLKNLPDDVKVDSRYYGDDYPANRDFHRQLAILNDADPDAFNLHAFSSEKLNLINVPQTPTLFNLYTMAEEIAHLEASKNRRPETETVQTLRADEQSLFASFPGTEGDMRTRYGAYEQGGFLYTPSEIASMSDEEKAEIEDIYGVPADKVRNTFSYPDYFESEQDYLEEMRAKSIAFETVFGKLDKTSSKNVEENTKTGRAIDLAESSYGENFAEYILATASPTLQAGIFHKHPELRERYFDDQGRFKKRNIQPDADFRMAMRAEDEEARKRTLKEFEEADDRNIVVKNLTNPRKSTFIEGYGRVGLAEGGKTPKTLPKRKPRRGELADVELRADLEEFIKDDQLARLGWDLYTSRDIKLVGLPISRGAKYGYSASGVYLPAEGRDTYPVFPSGLGYSEEQESQREKVGGAASFQGTFMEPMFEGVGKVLDPKAPTVTYFAEAPEIPKRDRSTAATRNDRAQVMITLAHELRHAALNHMKFEYGAPEMTLGGEESLMDYFDEKARRTASKKNALVSAIPLTKGREKRYKAARLSSYNKDMYEMYNELATEILKERGVPTIAPPEEKGFITKFMDKLFREPHPATGTLKKGDGKPVDYESEAMQSANF